MKEYTITIEIDEDGSIQAETKGTAGDICVKELDEILKNIEGESSFKNKPEYYVKNNKIVNELKNK